MIQRSTVLQNGTGLHARPAAQFVKVAAQYPCTITVGYGEKSASAKSIIALMALGAKEGATLIISAHGEQSEAAVTALCALVDSGFAH